ncbi:hypothetical protein Taro_035446 [Colocasia esculenta]|uniref:Retrotransposon gag domain-containing protein n=1 Tax=Colocasia esculenta TaxID=4460 RepID=A0A843WAI4_COLES|nr:hypothetical protein [Colocasia esculenta]
MASRGRRGGAPTCEDEPRHEEWAEQQAPAPQGSVLPPPPPVDYGVFMQGLVQAMQTQAHTQAALQAQLEAQVMLQDRADVWWASLLRTQFEDGTIEVAWDEFVRLFRAKFVPEHIQDRMEQEFLSLTQGSMIVLEYEARFVELSKYAPHIVTDERRKAKKFVMGLKPSLRTRLVAFDHRTLDEALSVACRQEGFAEEAYSCVPASGQEESSVPGTAASCNIQQCTGTFSTFPWCEEGVSPLREDTWWFRVLDDCGKVLEVRKQRPQDQGLSEASAGSPVRSASPSSDSSSSTSYRKTRKASSPSSSSMASRGRRGAHAREDEPRREERDEQKAPAP